MAHPDATGDMPEIRITQGDLSRIGLLLADHKGIWSWRAVEFLVRELLRSTVVTESEISPCTVTMRSRVAFCDTDTGVTKVVTLVYPGEWDVYDDAISILTPVGAALIGLTEGQSITYAGPDGLEKTIQLMKVLYQPESARRAEKAVRRRPLPS